MSEEQINIAIAEACGWTDISQYTQAVDGWYGYEPENGPHSQIPDYCNDLNAMHEAEKVLTSEQVTSYVDSLEFMNARWATPAFGTAAQRAEAFLRTLGKWEETK